MKQSTRLNQFYNKLLDEYNNGTRKHPVQSTISPYEAVIEAFRDAANSSYSIWKSAELGEYELWEMGFDFARKLKKTDKVCYFELEDQDEILIFKYRKIEDVICKIKKLLK